MDTEKHIRENNGELLVFDFAPRLKIVGTFHALNEKDKRTLDHLIGESDFVALEDNPARRAKEDKKLKVHLKPFRFSFAYDFGENRIYTNVTNGLYFYWFSKINNRDIIEVNEWVKKEIGIERDPKGNEFEYCLRVAKQENKDVYIVDMNIPRLFRELTSLSLREKLKHVFLKTFFDKDSKKHSEIVIDGRNDYMLNQIKMREGVSIEKLERKGILVCGYNHALKYKYPSDNFS